MHIPIVSRFEAAKPFTADEAWLLFRIAALAEAVGWTLLISGIAIERFLTPGDRTAVIIAGQLHGMLFFGYMAAAIGLYPSLGWSRLSGLVALLLSIPPYGSLVFERWAAWRRSKHGFKTYRHYLIYMQLVS